MTIDMKIGGGITTSQMGQSTVLSCHGSLTFQICDSGALEKDSKMELQKRLYKSRLLWPDASSNQYDTRQEEKKREDKTK